MKEQMAKYREWQKQNPEWELVCDIEDTDSLYVQFNELPKRERMSWIGTYRDNAKWAFDEYAVKTCKVETAVLCPDMQLRNVLDWPAGFCMLAFKTDNQADGGEEQAEYDKDCDHYNTYGWSATHG